MLTRVGDGAEVSRRAVGTAAGIAVGLATAVSLPAGGAAVAAVVRRGLHVERRLLQHRDEDGRPAVASGAAAARSSRAAVAAVAAKAAVSAPAATGTLAAGASLGAVATASAAASARADDAAVLEMQLRDLGQDRE